MIGAIGGAALGVVGGIIGGKSAKKQMRKMQEELARRRAENRDWYNRAYNEDATQRADAQRAITRAEEAMKSRNAAAAGTAAVMGGSNDAVVAAQDANNEMLADITSRIAVAGEERKAQIEQEYNARKDALAQQQMEINMQRAQAKAQATQGLFNAAGSIFDAVDWGGFGKKEK